MTLKGINTASIKQGDHLCLVTFKTLNANDKSRVLYMQINTLVDFLIILRSRMLKVSQRLSDKGETYKETLQAEMESLARNIPQIVASEVNQPDASNLIVSLAPKFKEESVSLIAVLQSEQVITLEIKDSQVEFIILAIQKAIETANDPHSMQIVGS